MKSPARIITAKPYIAELAKSMNPIETTPQFASTRRLPDRFGEDRRRWLFGQQRHREIRRSNFIRRVSAPPDQASEQAKKNFITLIIPKIILSRGRTSVTTATTHLSFSFLYLWLGACHLFLIAA
jgi:hypothetical protein